MRIKGHAGGYTFAMPQWRNVELSGGKYAEEHDRVRLAAVNDGETGERLQWN